MFLYERVLNLTENSLMAWKCDLFSKYDLLDYGEW